jgi:hypothetical protein
MRGGNVAPIQSLLGLGFCELQGVCVNGYSSVSQQRSLLSRLRYSIVFFEGLVLIPMLPSYEYHNLCTLPILEAASKVPYLKIPR